MHQNTKDMLENFTFDHLPDSLKEVSAPICDLAHHCANTLHGPELTEGLRKLLEAKDCLVRARLYTDRKAKEHGRPCRCGAVFAYHPVSGGCPEWH